MAGPGRQVLLAMCEEDLLRLGRLVLNHPPRLPAACPGPPATTRGRSLSAPAPARAVAAVPGGSALARHAAPHPSSPLSAGDGGGGAQAAPFALAQLTQGPTVAAGSQ